MVTPPYKRQELFKLVIIISFLPDYDKETPLIFRGGRGSSYFNRPQRQPSLSSRNFTCPSFPFRFGPAGTLTLW